MIQRKPIAIMALICALAVSISLAQANMAPPRDFVLGLTIEKSAEGPRIKSVEKGGVANEAGVKPGDLILGIDQRYAKTMPEEDLRAFAEDAHSWPIDVILARGDEIVTVRLAR